MASARPSVPEHQHGSATTVTHAVLQRPSPTQFFKVYQLRKDDKGAELLIDDVLLYEPN
jgi:hypothetical protein